MPQCTHGLQQNGTAMGSSLRVSKALATMVSLSESRDPRTSGQAAAKCEARGATASSSREWRCEVRNEEVGSKKKVDRVGLNGSGLVRRRLKPACCPRCKCVPMLSCSASVQVQMPSSPTDATTQASSGDSTSSYGGVAVPRWAPADKGRWSRATVGRGGEARRGGG